MNLMSNKHKQIYTTLNYTEHFLILVPAVTGCIAISAFASLFLLELQVLLATGLKTFAITARIKKYKSIIKKKKKHYEIVLLALTTLNRI